MTEPGALLVQTWTSTKDFIGGLLDLGLTAVQGSTRLIPHLTKRLTPYVDSGIVSTRWNKTQSVVDTNYQNFLLVFCRTKRSVSYTISGVCLLFKDLLLSGWSTSRDKTVDTPVDFPTLCVIDSSTSNRSSTPYSIPTPFEIFYPVF